MGWAEDARRKAAGGRGGVGIGGGVTMGRQRTMARALAEGITADQTAVRDRFGAPVQVGDLILYRPPYDLVFQVVALDPSVSVDPTRPPSPNVAVMVLEIQVPLQVPRNQPLTNVVVIGHLDPPAAQEGTEKPVPTANQGGLEKGPEGAERTTDPGTGAGVQEGGEGDTSTIPPDELPPIAAGPDRETDSVAPNGGPGPETLG